MYIFGYITVFILHFSVNLSLSIATDGFPDTALNSNSFIVGKLVDKFISFVFCCPS